MDWFFIHKIQNMIIRNYFWTEDSQRYWELNLLSMLCKTHKIQHQSLGPLEIPPNGLLLHPLGISAQEVTMTCNPVSLQLNMITLSKTRNKEIEWQIICHSVNIRKRRTLKSMLGNNKFALTQPCSVLGKIKDFSSTYERIQGFTRSMNGF